MSSSQYRKRFVAFVVVSLLVHLAIIVYLLLNPIQFEKAKQEPEKTTVEIKLKKKAEPKKEEPKKEEPKKEEPKKEEPKKAEPKKAEPKKAEPKKAEPKKAEPKKAEPKKAEPKKTEPKKEESKTDPLAERYSVDKAKDKKAEPRKAEPKKAEPKKTEPKKAEPKKAEPKKAEPKKAEPKNAEPKKAEPKKAEPKKAEPKKAEPKKAEPKKAEPKKAEPKKAEPKKAEPKKAEPRKAEPTTVEPPKGEPSGEPLPSDLAYWTKRLGSEKLLTDRDLKREIVFTEGENRSFDDRIQKAKREYRSLSPDQRQEYDYYLNKGAETIFANFVVPEEIKGLIKGEFRSEWRFVTDQEGYILEINLLKSSGYQQLDKAMLEALRTTVKLEFPKDLKTALYFASAPKVFYYDQSDILQ